MWCDGYVNKLNCGDPFTVYTYTNTSHCIPSIYTIFIHQSYLNKAGKKTQLSLGWRVELNKLVMHGQRQQVLSPPHPTPCQDQVSWAAGERMGLHPGCASGVTAVGVDVKESPNLQSAENPQVLTHSSLAFGRSEEELCCLLSSKNLSFESHMLTHLCSVLRNVKTSFGGLLLRPLGV